MKKRLVYSREPNRSRKKLRGICIISKCRKHSGKGYSICFKHKREKQKLDNPLRYWFDVWRQNARSRGIEFSVTIEYFKKFCDETGYLEKKGQGREGLTIDRKDYTKGYVEGNLQVLTKSQNSRKMWVDAKISRGHYPTKEELEELYGDFDPVKNLPEIPDPEPDEDGFMF